MEVELVYANCGFCGAEDHEVLYSGPQQSKYSNCKIVKCSDCGLVRTNPKPSQKFLEFLYKNEYYSRQIPDHKSLATKIKVFAIKNNLSIVYPRIIPFDIHPNASICDIGCGAGQWLSLMRLAYPSLNLYGFEIDAETAQAAGQQCAGDIQYGEFLNNSWPDGIFDFITFWDVFEHIADLKSTILETQRLLKPNGILVIVSPNFECIYSKYFRGNWWALQLNQHLYHFTKQTLSDILQFANLQPIFFTKPKIPTHAHWNLVNLVAEKKFKKEISFIESLALNSVKNSLKPFDKLYLSKFLPQHLMMCAQKIPVSAD
jgi:2-polyprenyl-3-methyl-5-hydroxy-6-metoxy-1,4-benzoquinol methylase